jgi:hypothetical protein
MAQSYTWLIFLIPVVFFLFAMRRSLHRFFCSDKNPRTTKLHIKSFADPPSPYGTVRFPELPSGTPGLIVGSGEVVPVLSAHPTSSPGTTKDGYESVPTTSLVQGYYATNSTPAVAADTPPQYAIVANDVL